jgi:hypothetical protein
MKLGMAILVFSTLATAENLAIDVERSTISIHVSKAGLFSAAGHDHWVRAPIASGTIEESLSRR